LPLFRPVFEPGLKQAFILAAKSEPQQPSK